jgi:hypothetical protein
MNKLVSKMLAGGALATLAAGWLMPGIARAQTADLQLRDPAQALILCDTSVERLTARCQQFDLQQLDACLNNANSTNQSNACDRTAENELTEINLTDGIRELTCKANSNYAPNPTDCGFGITLSGGVVSF